MIFFLGIFNTAHARSLLFSRMTLVVENNPFVSLRYIDDDFRITRYMAARCRLLNQFTTKNVIQTKQLL